MKKIMKKAFSLMLALVMVLSLAPMTALAADEQTLSVESGSATLESNWDYKEIKFKAPGNGVIKVSLAGTPGWDYQFINDTTGVWGDWLTSADNANNNLTYEVSAGNSCIIAIYAFDPSTSSDCAGNVIYDIQFIGEVVEGATDPTGASGDDAIPLEFEESIAYATPAGNSQTFYSVSVESGKTYTLSIQDRTGNNYSLYQYAMYQANWVADSANGAVEYTFTAQADEFIFAIGNRNLLGLSMVISLVEGAGSSGSENSNALVVGENSVHVTVENYYCAGTEVTFTAAEAGTYVISPAEDEENADVYVVGEYGAEWIEEYPYEFTLSADESITFLVGTSANMTLTEDDIDLVIEAKAGDSASNKLVLGENSVHVTVENYYCAGTEVTFTATETGTYVISPAEGEENADVYVVGEDGAEWIEEYPYEFTLSADESITFLVGTSANMTLTEDDIDLVITKKASGSEGGSGNEGDSEVGEDTDNEGAGTEEDPYVMIMGDNVVTFKEEGSYAYYVYTATEKGALLLTMSGDNTSWYYAGTVNGDNITQFINPNKSWETNQNSSTDAEPAALRTVYLNTGDKVLLTISTAENSEWTRPAGTVKFNAWFMAGAEPESDEVELEEYVIDDENMLQLGENTVELDPSAETTIFEFCPEEAGVYVFTTDNGVLGYWGATPNFVQDKTENKTNSLEYNLENAGPSIMVGVTGEGEATITVKKAGEAETKPTIPTIVYSNVVVPEAMDEFEVALPNTVDINDDVTDTAVLGADGFYHLNTADGPVLFVNFESEAISFLEAYGYGRLNGVVTNDDDEIIAIVDYNEAFMEYYAAANEDGCYPLTEDLITILKEVGANESWYGEEGWIGGDPEEAWMFACCYADNNTSVDVELEEAEKEDANVVIKDSGKVTADSLEAIIETTASDKVVFTVETEDATVTFEFVVEDMELVDGKETYDFSVELVDDYTDATEDEADIEEDGFVLRVNYSYEGKLPAAAVITIPVGDDYKNTTLYYYQILADGTLKYVCDAPVDANGNAKVTQDHCSDYVLLSEKVEADVPLTGDTTNVVLWFAVLALGAAAIAGSVVMRKKEF
ncbi:MAG: hypothetical protein IJA07_05825 [Agathobacter sp.]|nr:hypothetical protein [Agathobacter sp.]